MASADALEQSLPPGYGDLLTEVKTAVRSARVQAARQVRSGSPASAAALINGTRSNTWGISTCRPGPRCTESGRQPCV